MLVRLRLVGDGKGGVVVALARQGGADFIAADDQPQELVHLVYLTRYAIQIDQPSVDLAADAASGLDEHVGHRR